MLHINVQYPKRVIKLFIHYISNNAIKITNKRMLSIELSDVSKPKNVYQNF